MAGVCRCALLSTFYFRLGISHFHQTGSLRRSIHLPITNIEYTPTFLFDLHAEVDVIANASVGILMRSRKTKVVRKRGHGTVVVEIRRFTWSFSFFIYICTLHVHDMTIFAPQRHCVTVLTIASPDRSTIVIHYRS